MNMYEGDDLVVTDTTRPNRLKVKLLFGANFGRVCCCYDVLRYSVKSLLSA